MSNRGETTRVPDLEFPDRIQVGNTAPADYPAEAPGIARAVLAAAEAAQHGGNRSPEGSDRPDPGHYAATHTARQQLGGTPAFGWASDEDWATVGKHE